MSTPVGVPANLKQQLHDLATRIDAFRIAFDAHKDSRTIFAYTYVLITRHLAEALDTAGFGDPAWIVELAQAFAGKYIAALEAPARSSDLAPAWAVVFDTIRNRRTSVLEDLLFAITAHIDHDLPLALVEVGLIGANNISRIHDFHHVNDILATNIQAIVDAVTSRYEPFFRWLDHLEEKHAQVLTNYGFRISRGMAWYNAERLLDPASKAQAEPAINKSAIILINDVRRPPIWSLRVLLKILRWFASFFRRWPDPQQ
jgi:Family of unknown function (DUF5995)